MLPKRYFAAFVTMALTSVNTIKLHRAVTVAEHGNTIRNFRAHDYGLPPYCK